MILYSAHTVAAEIRERLPDLPIKKLHKLLHYCQGHHLASFGEPLFAESIQAWDRGPVVAELWRTEKYGTNPGPLAREPLDQGALNTVGYVVSRYGSMTGADLEALTHHETPWTVASARRKVSGDQRIELQEIRAFFADRHFDQADDDLDDPAEKYELPRADVVDWLSGAHQRLQDDLTVGSVDDVHSLARS